MLSVLARSAVGSTTFVSVANPYWGRRRSVGIDFDTPPVSGPDHVRSIDATDDIDDTSTWIDTEPAGNSSAAQPPRSQAVLAIRRRAVELLDANA